MRELTLAEINEVAGAAGAAVVSLLPGPAAGVSVVVGAANGSAPAPFGITATTGTASGPTPGNVGGRYRVEDMDKQSSMENVPGGVFGRFIAELIEDFS